MSRKFKNILMLIILVVLLTTSGLSVYSVYKDNIANENVVQNDDFSKIPGNWMNDSDMEEPPEKPDGESNMEEPPEKPDGESNMNDSSSNQPPELPSNGDKGNLDNKSAENTDSSSISTKHYILFGIQSLGISLIIIYLIMSKFNKKTFKETFVSSDKVIIYILSIVILTCCLIGIEYFVLNNNSLSQSVNEHDQNNNMNNQNISYAGATEIVEDTEIDSGEYKSSNVDENAILVSGDIDATIENVSVEKTGDSDGGDNTSFYGMNSAILAKSGANLTLKNLTITTDATGANGVFSYGGSATTNNTSSDGTVINISDSKITTNKDNSGGIMTTGGGTTNAYNLIINTSGISSAAIRTDRGGGVVNVDGGTYTTTGSGSPAIYSTAEISVKNATLVSKVAEGIVIEGKNSVIIEDCDLTDSNTKLNGLSTTYKNIFLYQSMSGDADTGNSSFTAIDSKITTNNGDTFYITNTSSTINLTNNTIVNNDKNGNFLRAKADSWGNDGANGGEVVLTLNNQKVFGNIVIDNISTLDMVMNKNSYYEGTINSDNTAKSLKLKLDKSSSIKLTGNSYITSLDNEDISNSNIDFNGYKLYVNGVAIN